MQKKISVFLKAGAANMSAPLGPILNQYEYDFNDMIIDFNNKTKIYEDLNWIFHLLILLEEKKKYNYIILFPSASFFLKFLSFNNFIQKTDIYNIAKLKTSFNFINLKIIYKILLGNIYSLKLKIIND